MTSTIKKLIRKLVRKFGYDIIAIGKGIRDYPGSPDRPVGKMDFLLQDLKARGFDCRSVLDVGACIAYWSRVAKEVFPDAKFTLIEPLSETREMLDKFCNDFPGTVLVPNGVAAERGEKVFTIWDDLFGSSFLIERDKSLLAEGKQRIVKMITIDDLVNEGMEIPDLVKLDIQGYELEALRGAKKLFGQTEVFIMEVSLFVFHNSMPILKDVINFMDERGYKVYDFPGFLRRPHDGALGQCDICFVKSDGMFRSSDSWD